MTLSCTTNKGSICGQGSLSVVESIHFVVGGLLTPGGEARDLHTGAICPHLATFMTLSGTEFALTRFVIPTAVGGAATWRLDDHHWSKAVVAFELLPSAWRPPCRGRSPTLCRGPVWPS